MTPPPAASSAAPSGASPAAAPAASAAPSSPSPSAARPAPKILYKRAGVASAPFLSRRWSFGPDHLLLAERRGIVVEYRRFHYSDIQSVLFWPTRGQLYRVLVLLGLAAVWLWALAELNLPWAMLSVAVAAAAAIFVETRLGPCCQSELRTASSRVRAPLDRRLRRARRFALELRARCEAAQGGPLSPSAGASPLDLRALAPAAATLGVRRRRYAGRRWSAAIWLLIAALFFAACNDVLVASRVLSSPFLGLLLGLLTFAALVWSLVNVCAFAVLPPVRRFVWSVFALGVGWVTAWICVAIVLSIAAAEQHIPVHLDPSVLRSAGRGMAAVNLLVALAGVLISHDGHYEPAPETATAPAPGPPPEPRLEHTPAATPPAPRSPDSAVSADSAPTASQP